MNHLHITGQSGSGKTHLLATMLIDIIEKQSNKNIILIEVFKNLTHFSKLMDFTEININSFEELETQKEVLQNNKRIVINLEDMDVHNQDASKRKKQNLEKEKIIKTINKFTDENYLIVLDEFYYFGILDYSTKFSKLFNNNQSIVTTSQSLKEGGYEIVINPFVDNEQQTLNNLKRLLQIGGTSYFDNGTETLLKIFTKIFNQLVKEEKIDFSFDEFQDICSLETIFINSEKYIDISNISELGIDINSTIEKELVELWLSYKLIDKKPTKSIITQLNYFMNSLYKLKNMIAVDSMIFLKTSETEYLENMYGINEYDIKIDIKANKYSRVLMTRDREKYIIEN